MAEETQGETTILDSSPEVTQWHSDENSELVMQKGWKTADDAIKGYKEVETMMSGRVKIPTETSTAEEKSSFYKSLGVPEGPEGYEIKDVPGNINRNEDAELALKGVAFAGNCPKATFEAIVKAFYQRESEALIASKTEGEALLQEEWSKPGQYKANIEIMTRAVDEFFSDESKAIFEATGIGNHPAIVKDLHNIGLKMLSDTLIKGTTPGESPEDKDWKPSSPKSPEMYRNGDDDISKRSRAWFEANTEFRY